MVYCPDVYNSRGRPHTDPCAVFCSPLDVLAWKSEAETRLASIPADLTADEQAQRDDLQRRFDRSKLFDSNSDTAKDYARIAYDASCLALTAAQRVRPDTPTVTDPKAPDPGSDFDWPRVDLPDLPQLPNLDQLLPLLLIAGVVLLALTTRDR